MVSCTELVVQGLSRGIISTLVVALNGGAFLVGTALLFLQLIPVMLPTTIAAYAVVGEREQRTLESVLTTPVTGRELLGGKAAAAVLPAVLISWLLFGVYVGLAELFAPRVVVDQIWTTDQVVAMALLAPALAGFAILAGIIVSLRSSDFRVAQQVAVLAAAPVIGFVALVTLAITAVVRGVRRRRGPQAP